MTTIRRARIRRVAGRVIVGVETAAGARGLGEAFGDVERSTGALAAWARDPAVDAATIEPAAARFAIETALLDATGRERGVSVARLLVTTPATRVPINALVASPGEACAAIARGIRTVKLKTTEPASVAAMRAAIGPDVGLRVDVNRRWPLADALSRLGELRELGVEYVEEPCAETLAIAAAAPVPVALDETLAELDDTERIAPPIAAVILKPTRLGLRRSLALAHHARRLGIAPIVTHAFEGPIATAACAELALAIGGERAVGLDTHAGLAAWTTAVPQLAPDAVRDTARPGLGLDLATLAADLAALEGLRW